MNWTDWFMSLARTVASKSKDPSTKVGAVIVRRDNTIVSVGYNGFPRGIADTAERLNDRPTKLGLTVHAEMNAVLAAHTSVWSCTLYTTFMPCDRCFVHLIQAGIKKVVYPVPSAEQEERWGESFERVRLMAIEAGIILEPYWWPT